MADPFACFGGDDSDSDSSSADEGNTINNNSQNEDDKNIDRARQLMDTYNNNTNTTKNNSSNTASPTTFQFHSSYEDQKARTSLLPWLNHNPLYLGPMALSKCKEGGGRGYIATQDLPPGTCVLIEQPIVKGWSEVQMGKKLGLESIQYIFERDDAKLVIQCMEELHPRREEVLEIYKEGVDAATSTDVDSLDRTQIIDMISNMNSDTSYVQQVKSLVEYAKDHNITNSDGSHIEDIDINRLLLTLRYNGFDSGLYLHFSMVNHNEDPNLIKFRPNIDEHEDGLYYSEARTTRHVRKGEALTLHYLENPREVSHATRRLILWDQHRFDIGDESAYKQFLDNGLYSDNERGNHIYESELIHGKFPKSTKEGADNGEENDERDNVATTDNIEKSLDDLEEMLVEIQAITQLQSNGKNADDTTFDRAAALELTIGELIFASTSTLGNANHILLSRCWRLQIDIIEVILSHYTPKLTEKQSVDLVARFLLSVKPLLESQRCRLGIDHPDVARTYQDYSMALQVLLSHPKKLLSLNLGSLDQCSKMEHHSRKEKERIDAMYPKDVDIILGSVKRK